MRNIKAVDTGTDNSAPPDDSAKRFAQPVENPLPEYLTSAEAAVYIRLSQSSLAKARLRGDGCPYSKCGAKVIYLRRDLDAWMEANRRHSTSDGAK